MARTCNHPGCGGALVARGLCGIHYRAALAANPNLRMQTQTRNTVREQLPALHSTIMAQTGLCSETVKRTLQWLRDNGQAHIGSYDPPSGGSNFQPVYALGPGEDAVLTRQMQREHRRRNWVKGYHRRNLMQKTQSLPKSSLWAAALLAA